MALTKHGFVLHCRDCGKDLHQSRTEDYGDDRCDECIDKREQAATAKACDPTPSPLDPVSILVIGDRVWGKGKTLRDAIKKASDNNGHRAVTKYVAFLVHEDSYVDSMGRISYPLPWHPREIHRVPKDLK